jgi:hypothetical protein
MGEIKPLGSEKLQGDEKVKRIIELFGTTKKNINESKTLNIEYIKKNKNSVYGIVRENGSYYVKKGLNESTLDYIGGMFMKNKNRFSSYAEALKRLELISNQEILSEGKRYILKNKKSDSMDTPTDNTDLSGIGLDDEPKDDFPTNDDDINGELGDNLDDSLDDSLDDDSEEKTKKSDYMSQIQKHSGSLGQSLRDEKENLESDDIKYVINMILSALDLSILDDDDKQDIITRFESNNDITDTENDFDFSDEEEPEDEEEIDEVIGKLENFINNSMDDEEIDEQEDEEIDLSSISMGGGDVESELSEEEISEKDEDVEIDIEEVKRKISDTVNATLSDIFK